VRHAYTLLDATHELAPDGRLRRVHLRKSLFKVKEWGWDVFVRRTAKLRHALGLRRARTIH